MFFQRLNLAAQSGLGDAQPLGGMSKMQFLGYRNEIPQLAQFHDISVMPICYYWNLPMYWTYQSDSEHSKSLYFLATSGNERNLRFHGGR